MGRLTTIKPRLIASPGRSMQVISSDSWRGDKSSSTKRGYGYKWQKSRERFLARHPLCLSCEDQGRVVAATDVDHVIPHRGDQTLFWDESNWQALCHSCHSIKTQAESKQPAS